MFSLSIHSLMNNEIDFGSWLLWIILQRMYEKIEISLIHRRPFLWIYIGYGITGWYCSSTVKVLRTFRSGFRNCYANFHSYEQCSSLLCFFPHFHQHFYFSFIIAILTDMKWYFIVLICISLIISNVKKTFYTFVI